ncbi:avidin-related protein 1-like [Protobothrops mucrosquamatus]|uniref:avidin-related protein 1-like n=1 Tax=Protobothrops mucrosquamatus TaxID=103944 RepID=UPI00077579FB|nr:avidin-related protein 1-like [Protobothrops mucrosquamatus]
MAIGLAALGLLAFLLGCSGTFAEPPNLERATKCSLSGSWKNDLNSTMESNSVSNTGVFIGVYKTAVSGSGKPVPPSPLQGIQHQGLQPTFGFTVSWILTESTAVFVGQCLVNNSGKDHLKTTWLLREKVGSAANDWGATRVGTDTFYRSE